MEIGDKTQLTAFTLGLKYRSPWKVFFGVLIGLTGVTAIAVIIGIILKTTFEYELLKPVIATLFILGGILLLFHEIKNQKNDSIRMCPVSLEKCEKSKENCSEIEECELYLDEVVRKGALFNSAVIMFFAELGDKTMLMGLGLATQFDPLGVFVGAVIALALINSIGVFMGDKIAQKVPRKILGYASALLFLITGLFILLL